MASGLVPVKPGKTLLLWKGLFNRHKELIYVVVDHGCDASLFREGKQMWQYTREYIRAPEAMKPAIQGDTTSLDGKALQEFLLPSSWIFVAHLYEDNAEAVSLADNMFAQHYKAPAEIRTLFVPERERNAT